MASIFVAWSILSVPMPIPVAFVDHCCKVLSSQAEAFCRKRSTQFWVRWPRRLKHKQKRNRKQKKENANKKIENTNEKKETQMKKENGLSKQETRRA